MRYDRGVRLRRGPHAVRPARRRAGRSPGRTTWPRSPSGRCSTAPPGSTRPRSTRWCSATPTAPARTTATSARMAVLLAGLPVSVPGDDGQPAVRVEPGRRDRSRSRTIETGDADVVVAGGVESMTRAPWVLPKPDEAVPDRRRSPRCRRRSAGGWSTRGCRRSGRSRSARPTSSCERETRHLPRAAGRVRRPVAPAGRTSLGRGLLRRPGRAPSPTPTLDRDEAIRPGSTPEKLAALKPSFRPDGTITAGNASPLNDGASAVLLGSAGAADRHRPRPARPDRRPRGDALEPQDFGFAPVEAAEPGAGAGPASAGPTSARSSSTRRSRCSRSPACDAWDDRPGDRQHPRRRDRDRSPARRVRRADPRHAGARSCGPTGSAGASPRSASASGRAWPWCWRT